VIVDSGHIRERDLDLVMPAAPLEAVMSGEVWATVYDRLAELIREHHTTLVFANTRRMVERVSRHLAERLGEQAVAAHHGSLSKETRFDAEQRLKAGQLKVMVATASLELGIDIGDVELVCQLGSPRSISVFLQRVGRANHSVGGVPKGRIFPSSRDELVDCVALLDSVRRGELDRLHIPAHPLDVLSQQIVAEIAAREYGAQGFRRRGAHVVGRHQHQTRPPRHLSASRCRQQGAAPAQGCTPHGHHLRRRHPRQRRLPGDP
jgi:ATP-dependent Lhr-like helicase